MGIVDTQFVAASFNLVAGLGALTLVRVELVRTRDLRLFVANRVAGATPCDVLAKDAKGPRHRQQGIHDLPDAPAQRVPGCLAATRGDMGG